MHPVDTPIDTEAVLTVREPAQVRALNHPTRVAILDALRDPAAAATVARALGQPRQLVNYHMKALEEAGLIERVEERRKGNFIEVIYRSVARSFVVAAEASWTPRRAETIRQQHALGTLIDLGGRLQRDAARLLERATFEGVTIPSVAATAELRFLDEAARAAFVEGYVSALRSLVEQHASKEGEPYRVVLAVYPADEQVEAP